MVTLIHYTPMQILKLISLNQFYNLSFNFIYFTQTFLCISASAHLHRLEVQDFSNKYKFFYCEQCITGIFQSNITLLLKWLCSEICLTKISSCKMYEVVIKMLPGWKTILYSFCLTKQYRTKAKDKNFAEYLKQTIYW